MCGPRAKCSKEQSISHEGPLNKGSVHQAWDFAFCFLWVLWERKLWEFPFLSLQKTSLLKAQPGGSRAPPECWESKGGSAAGFLPDNHSSWGLNTALALAVFTFGKAWVRLPFLPDHGWGTEGQGGCCPAGHLTKISHCCFAAAGICVLPTWAHCVWPASPQITWSDRISLVLCFPRTKGPDVSWVDKRHYFNSGKVFNPFSGKHSKQVAYGYHHGKNKLFFDSFW